MRPLSRRWLILLAPLLALAAGYLTGRRPATVTSAAATVPGSPLTLEYPTSWRATSAPAALSGVGIARAVTIAPAGRTSAGGLLAGTLEEQGAPLSTALLAKLHSPVRSEAVWLVSTAAYRYSNLSIAGAHIDATAYAIPMASGKFTLVLCFAAAGHRAVRHRCEEIVEGGQSAEPQVGQFAELNPQPRYASLLGAALRALAKARARARSAMAGTPSAATFAAGARRLASAFAATSAVLKAMGAPFVAARASTTLESATLAAQSAYETLAQAAERGQQRQFEIARQRATQAEAEVRATLRSFALLGYTLA